MEENGGKGVLEEGREGLWGAENGRFEQVFRGAPQGVLARGD